MNKNVKPIPEGYCTVTPSLTVEGCKKAIEFYKKAFGAQETHPPCLCPQTGKVMHADLKIGNSTIMLGDTFPEMKCMPTKSRFYLYVNDCDAAYAKATKAGCKAEQPVTDMFWGDRCGCVSDAWGNQWTFATHVEDLTPEQMKERQEAFFAAAAR